MVWSVDSGTSASLNSNLWLVRFCYLRVTITISGVERNKLVTRYINMYILFFSIIFIHNPNNNEKYDAKLDNIRPFILNYSSCHHYHHT